MLVDWHIGNGIESLATNRHSATVCTLTVPVPSLDKRGGRR